MYDFETTTTAHSQFVIIMLINKQFTATNLPCDLYSNHARILFREINNSHVVNRSAMKDTRTLSTVNLVTEYHLRDFISIRYLQLAYRRAS